MRMSYLKFLLYFDPLNTATILQTANFDFGILFNFSTILEMFQILAFWPPNTTATSDQVHVFVVRVLQANICTTNSPPGHITELCYQ